MRNRLLTVVLAMIAFTAINSCDVIEAPYTESNEFRIDTTRKKVFLEEFTGHLCGNCPEAAELAHKLVVRYKGWVIPMSIHATSLARPNSVHPYDFRTAVGNELEQTFKIPATPNGLVNRSPYSGSVVIPQDSWEGAILAEMEKPAEFKIYMSPDYNSSSRELTLNVAVDCLVGADSEDYLVIYLTEDKIIKYQKDDTRENIDVYDYEHNHVLRASINGNWGEALTTENSPVGSGKTVSKVLNYTVSPSADWVLENMNLIAVVYDKSTNNVKQAEIVKIID